MSFTGLFGLESWMLSGNKGQQEKGQSKNVRTQKENTEKVSITSYGMSVEDMER